MCCLITTYVYMNKGKSHSRSTDHLFYVFDDNSNIGAVRDSRLELLNQRLTDSFYAQERKLYKRSGHSKHQLLMSKYLGSAGKSCSTRSCSKDETCRVKINGFNRTRNKRGAVQLSGIGCLGKLK